MNNPLKHLWVSTFIRKFASYIIMRKCGHTTATTKLNKT